MKKYLLGFALVLALIACGQKGAEPKHNDQEVEDSKKDQKDNSKRDLPLVTEDTVKLFNNNEIFISKEKNKDDKYELRSIVDKVELKGLSEKNTGAGKLEGLKADKSKVTMLVSDDLNTVTIETYDTNNRKVLSQVAKKQGSLTEETYKAGKLSAKKITRSNDTTIEYTEMTDADNASKAVETLKNGITLEGSLVGGKTTLTIKEGTVTLKKEIEKAGTVKLFLDDTTSGTTKKTAVWNDTSNTLTVSADSKKIKDFVFLTDGTITVQNYDTAGTTLEGKATEIKDLTALKAALK
ncbi:MULTISPECIES: outer surface lipoprotein OspB [Borreliella]|uniref:Outer surface lipoprotein OspB n=1 Tax=Borrelia garinii subsp. bavariensis (strain ATCC BAA-2496 / DSM 23469 / PBi) TaxID=290434 RepID=A0A7I6GV50_BORGP|nr:MULTISPECIES: outer surface lipoprotein OspB [Borreliella]AAT93774.1 outer surface protein B [Borreliella bavariensis PBi]AZA27171.1 outer surface lipoprotein OspB [Borreliella bavariensis PBi]WLN24517.1 outer surface lipoprotein OspB [Borreliella bavariensis]